MQYVGEKRPNRKHETKREGEKRQREGEKRQNREQEMQRRN